jgi:hypothetical protein
MSNDAQNESVALDKDAAAASTASKKPGRDPALAARDELMARADAHIEAERAAEHQRFLASADADPRAALLASEMDREARGLPTQADEQRGVAPETVDGAASVEPVATNRREAQRISNKGDDPLGEFVVRVEGKPMFKTIVHGKERLIPLERARAELQKLGAGDERLRAAAAQAADLKAREERIRAAEAQMSVRQHPSAQAPAVDYRKLAGEAVRSLVSEPEDKAAERLAETFRQIGQAAQAPAVDVAALTRMAREEATRTIAAEREKEALGSGFDQFTKNYPDIAADSDLFALADRKSEVIAAEHPEWSAGKIMDEAGKQTRAWLTSIGAPVKTVTRENATRGNQQRKQNLVPMPQPRSAAPAPQSEEADDNSPAATLAAIRKQRGQPG